MVCSVRCVVCGMQCAVCIGDVRCLVVYSAVHRAGNNTNIYSHRHELSDCRPYPRGHAEQDSGVEKQSEHEALHAERKIKKCDYYSEICVCVYAYVYEKCKCKQHNYLLQSRKIYKTEELLV